METYILIAAATLAGVVVGAAPYSPFPAQIEHQGTAKYKKCDAGAPGICRIAG